MNRLTAKQIREAIRKLPEAERQQLLDELYGEIFEETPADMAAIAEGMEQADRGELISHEDLADYMVARRKERQHVREHPPQMDPSGG